MNRRHAIAQWGSLIPFEYLEYLKSVINNQPLVFIEKKQKQRSYDISNIVEYREYKGIVYSKL